MSAQGNINATLITHHNHPSTKNLIYRQTTHPRETHALRVTQTSQGLAGGHWANARPSPGLKSPDRGPARKKKIGQGKPTKANQTRSKKP